MSRDVTYNLTKYLPRNTKKNRKTIKKECQLRLSGILQKNLQLSVIINNFSNFFQTSC